jgi:hypothetical protein
MLSASLITVSLILGYVVVIALIMVSTFAIVKLRPQLAVENHRLSRRYKLLQDALWFLYSALGGYIAIVAAAEASISLTAALLATILVIAFWRNPEEAQQRGLPHMLLTSACIVAGIASAYLLRAWQTP